MLDLTQKYEAISYTWKIWTFLLVFKQFTYAFWKKKIFKGNTEVFRK